ncbi:hypothetical protein KDD30_20380 (plasmid) [Photobacterium sp. GJ3]|uniref:CmcJ/NvfI family oxidoreductase n=1 Tax=Photobacterium sp. GJ3 TaxID=2829502 RepID=UPI001B8AEE7D|nr:CmcJ/NvfI family oxidoreductase [Photobacterium sp. GJ3]QUJ70452.1 hypothetical protein KDD30_20380 [Photobacterium sp. GJ3]
MAENTAGNKQQGARAQLNYHLDDGSPLQILIDADGIPGKRIDPPLETITIHLEDVRDSLPVFKDGGLEFTVSPTQVESFEPLENIKAQYDNESEALIKKVTGASEVVIFDHTIRVDGPGVRPPARHVHGDYNATSALKRLKDVLGEEQAAQWVESGFGIVNIWRPIVGPVQRAPLAFIDPATMDEKDWLDIDIVYPDRIGHIIGLKYSEQHRWVYWPEMTTDNAVVFNVYSSTGLAPVAHSAADVIGTPKDAPTRKSIETRCLAKFERS